MKLVLSVFALTCLGTWPAIADDIPNCPTPAGVHGTTVLSDLPTPVMNLLRQMVPNITPADAPFNCGDALLPGQTALDRRFIRAFSKGNRWAVAYEAAGRGYNDPVLLFDFANNGAIIEGRTISFLATVCADMIRLLDSPPPQI